MKIDVSAMHTEAQFEDLYAVTYNGLEITSPVDAPIPWDAQIVPMPGVVVIEGAAGPHGAGSCSIRVIKAQFHRHYTVEVNPREGKVQEAVDYLTSLGIKIL